MAAAGSQQASDLYDRHHGAELIFNREVMAATGLDPARCFLRLAGAPSIVVE